MRAGDAQIMDSRILHAGLDNRSADRRRTLFYFTIQNPACCARDFVGVPPGSKWPDGMRHLSNRVVLRGWRERTDCVRSGQLSQCRRRRNTDRL